MCKANCGSGCNRSIVAQVLYRRERKPSIANAEPDDIASQSANQKNSPTLHANLLSRKLGLQSRRTTQLSSGGRAESRDVTRNQDRGRRLLERLVRLLERLVHPPSRVPLSHQARNLAAVHSSSYLLLCRWPWCCCPFCFWCIEPLRSARWFDCRRTQLAQPGRVTR